MYVIPPFMYWFELSVDKGIFYLFDGVGTNDAKPNNTPVRPQPWKAISRKYRLENI